MTLSTIKYTQICESEIGFKLIQQPRDEYILNIPGVKICQIFLSPLQLSLLFFFFKVIIGIHDVMNVNIF